LKVFLAFLICKLLRKSKINKIIEKSIKKENGLLLAQIKKKVKILVKTIFHD